MEANRVAISDRRGVVGVRRTCRKGVRGYRHDGSQRNHQNRRCALTKEGQKTLGEKLEGKSGERKSQGGPPV